MIVVAILGLLAAIAIPNYVHARTSTQVNLCISNLYALSKAKDQWATEHWKKPTDTPEISEIESYLRGGHLPPCPAQGDYTLRTVAQNPVCSFSGRGHLISPLDLETE